MTVENFSWVIEGVLAGSAQLGGFDWTYGSSALDSRDLDSIGDEGIKAVVSLTTVPLDAEELAKREIRYLHLPVMDMRAPSIEVIERFVEFVNCSRKEGHPVLVHCGAGLGRTGTAIACYLVYEGMTGPDAIEEVRAARPGSIETIEQEALIHRYRRHLDQGHTSRSNSPQS